MSFDRTTILRGPGKVAFGGADFFSESPITVELMMEREDRNTDAFGVLKRPIGNKMVRITFTPTAWDDLSVLFPYGAVALGASLFGASDAAAVITPINGSALTINNVAVTKMPDIILSATGSQFGQVELTGLITNSSESDALASYLAQGTAATGVALTGIDKTKILNGVYSATYNSTTYHSQEGFTISFEQSNGEQRVDGHGLVNMFLESLVVTCAFRPVGLTEAAYVALFGFATAIGAEPTRYDLTVEGAAAGNPSVVLQDCEVNPGSLVFGRQENRNGELTFRTARDESSGSLVELFTVGTVSA